MTLSDHQWEFLQDIAMLIMFAWHKNIKLTGGELQRTEEMQRIYLAQKKTKTLNSQHLKKLAIDFAVFKPGEDVPTYDWDSIKVLGDYWESLNPLNRWGGDFNKDNIKNGFIDSPHFERLV